ncbi:hypothetical protein VCSRO165_3181 [Vibrio cholerae]|nr:hypothetical protein [Vibrio cholerae]GHY44061.1 hypothetical protein VCSRO165_3181 [Vibrio cholerae]
MLESRNFNGVEIFRPSEEHEKRVYKRIKESVFKSFSPGTYTDKTQVVEIVNFLYQEYYKILDENLPRVAPRKFAAFLATEYELYGKVSDMYKQKKLSEKDQELWLSYASYARRGIKHLFELLCRSKMDSSEVERTREKQEDAISMAFIAAEELVSLYMRSETYRSFLDSITLRLDPTEHIYFHVEEDSSINLDIRSSVLDFNKYVPKTMLHNDINAQEEILGKSFVETLGLGFKDTIGTIKWLIVTYSDESNPERLGFFELQEAVSIMIDHFRLTAEQAMRILEGFCLSSETMIERELYKPKQEYRAYKRAFFKDQCDGKELVFFSRRMALECLDLLISDVPFKKLPVEWKSNNIKSALDVMSFKAGRWFEYIVTQNLEMLGIIGSSSVKTLRLSATEKLNVPPDVGEIDFLGFHEKQELLVIIEIKQVGFTTEPRMYLDDLSKFVTKSKNYSEQFRKKFNWARKNVESIEKHFSHNFNVDAKLNTAGYAMITLYPTVASTKIHDFTCISITDFMNQSLESTAWPFSKGSVHRSASFQYDV